MIDRILVNREECEVRVAFLEGPNIVELHTEKSDQQTIVNNIYRGKVQDVVPGLQAAFIDVGLERNMFLHFMDIRPEALVLGADDQTAALREAAEKPIPGRIDRPGRRPRQDPNSPQAAPPVRKGDDILIQVVKDEIGGKAPRATTNLSLAGRYLVMLPFPSQEGGVSRKIAVGQDRFRLKKLLADLRGDDYSFIVRTAGVDQDEEAIRKDAESLTRVWDAILAKYKALRGPGLIHNDHNLLSRLVRDAFPSDFKEAICDDAGDAETLRAEVREHIPTANASISVYDGVENVFEHHGVEKQIERALDQKFWLKSGGYLIVDENEALTAIDVNTGRFTGSKDQEKTSLRTNLEACEAIAHLIRLRDIGGIIVVDFIDMLSRQHQEKVSEELRRALKADRAKLSVGKIGDFGLMVLTRKRQRMSLLRQTHEISPYCGGTGYVKNADEVFRRLKYDIRRAMALEKNLAGFLVSAHPRFTDALERRFRPFLEKLKRMQRIEVVLRADADYHIEDYQITPLRRPEGPTLRLPQARVDEGHRRLRSMEAPAGLLHHVAPAAASEDAVFDRAMQEDGYDEDAEDSDDLAGRHDVFVADERDSVVADDENGEEPLVRLGDDEDEGEEDDEEEAPSAGARSGAGSAPQGNRGGEEGQGGGRRRRRRRESSSERRARRRRMREQEAAEGGVAPADPAAPPSAVPVPRASAPAFPGEEDEEEDDSQIKFLSKLPPEAGVRDFRPLDMLDAEEGFEDEGEEDEDGPQPGNDASQPDPNDPMNRRRTRRGSRGGRNRRRREDDQPGFNPQQQQPRGNFQGGGNPQYGSQGRPQQPRPQQGGGQRPPQQPPQQQPPRNPQQPQGGGRGQRGRGPQHAGRPEAPAPVVAAAPAPAPVVAAVAPAAPVVPPAPPPPPPPPAVEEPKPKLRLKLAPKSSLLPIADVLSAVTQAVDTLKGAEASAVVPKAPVPPVAPVVVGSEERDEPELIPDDVTEEIREVIESEPDSDVPSPRRRGAAASKGRGSKKKPAEAKAAAPKAEPAPEPAAPPATAVAPAQPVPEEIAVGSDAAASEEAKPKGRARKGSTRAAKPAPAPAEAEKEATPKGRKPASRTPRGRKS